MTTGALNHTLFMTKTAENRSLYGAAYAHLATKGSTPPPPACRLCKGTKLSKDFANLFEVLAADDNLQVRGIIKLCCDSAR